MSTGAVRADISSDDHFFAGEDRTLEWTVRGPDNLDGSPGAIQNITGWTIEFEFRMTRDAATRILVKNNKTGDPNFSADVSIANGAGGLVDVILRRADMLNLAGGTYFYVLARIDSGAYAVLAYGDLVLSKGD